MSTLRMKNVMPLGYIAAFIAIVCIIVPNELLAQKIMTLDEALNIALKQSNTIISQKNSFVQDSIRNQVTIAQQKTTTTLNFGLPTYSRSISETPNQNGTTYSDNNSLRTSGTLTISQPIRLTNGTMSFSGDYSTVNSYRTNKNVYSSVTKALAGQFKVPVGSKYTEIVKTENHSWSDNFSISYSQQLFQPNQLKYNWDKSKRDWKLSELTFNNTENSIWKSVLTSFYNLYKAKRSLQISEDNFQLTKNNAEITENKFNAGLIPEVDAMRMRVEFANAQDSQEKGKINYKKQLDQFKRLIGLDLSIDIDVTASIEEQAIKIIEINPERAIQLALENDVSLKRTENNLTNTEFSIKTQTARDRIQASLSLNYGINEQDELTNFWGGDWDFAKNLLTNMNGTNGASLRLTIPVWDNGVRKYNIQTSTLSLEQSRKDFTNQQDNLRQQVQNAIDEINNAYNRIRLMGGNVAVAEKMNEINQVKYSLGELTPDQLTNSINSVRTAKENVLDAQISYVLALASLYTLTTWDFENNCFLNDTVKKYLKQ